MRSNTSANVSFQHRSEGFVRWHFVFCLYIYIPSEVWIVYHVQDFTNHPSSEIPMLNIHQRSGNSPHQYRPYPDNCSDRIVDWSDIHGTDWRGWSIVWPCQKSQLFKVRSPKKIFPIGEINKSKERTQSFSFGSWNVPMWNVWNLYNLLHRTKFISNISSNENLFSLGFWLSIKLMNLIIPYPLSPPGSVSSPLRFLLTRYDLEK